MQARVLAMALCLSVSVCVRVYHKSALYQIDLVLTRRLLFTSPTLRYKEIQISTK